MINIEDFRELIESMDIIAENKLKMASQFYYCLVKNVSNNKCTIVFNNKEYVVPFYGGSPKVNKTYAVFLPQNNMNQAFVIGEGASGGSGGAGIAIQPDPPTGDELVWIDTDDPGTQHIIPEIDDNNVSEDDTWSSQKISDEILSADVFHVGDSFNFGAGAVFNGYLANNNNGTMYCVLPKKIGSDITGANISWTSCNWIMRPNQALSQNFSASSLTPISGGNQVIVNFTTNITSTQYFIPILLNLSNLTFTFN